MSDSSSYSSSCSSSSSQQDKDNFKSNEKSMESRSSIDDDKSEQALQQPQLYFQSGQKNYDPLDFLKPKKRKTRVAISSDMVTQIRVYFKEMDEDKAQDPDKPSHTLSKIAEYLNLSYQTVLRLKRQYNKDPMMSKHYGPICKTKMDCRRTQVTKRRLQMLESMIKQNPLLTYDQIVHKINQKPQILRVPGQPQIQQQTITRLLSRIGYSKTRVNRQIYIKNSPENVQRRYHYSMSYKEILKSSERIVFLGVCRFHMFMFRNRGWAKYHQLLKPASIPDIVVTVLSMISHGGIALWEMFQQSCHFQEKLTKMYFEMQYFIKGGIEHLIIDNKLIEERKRIQNLQSGDTAVVKAKMIFLPPESAFLSPTQGWFDEVKVQVKKSDFKNSTELLSSVCQKCKKYGPNFKANQHLYKMQEYVDMSLRRYNFG